VLFRSGIFPVCRTVFEIVNEQFPGPGGSTLMLSLAQDDVFIEKKKSYNTTLRIIAMVA